MTISFITKSPHAEDTARVKAMLRGDERAFRAFFDEYYDRLFRFVIARVNGDQHHAEDIVQQALMNAIRGMRHYRGEAKLQTWVFTVCQNAITDFHRRESLRNESILAENSASAVREAVLDTPAPDLDNPVESAEAEEDATSIKETLSRLPESYGTALEWKYLHGWSAKEIGLKLGISHEATSSLLARAKRSFAEEHQQHKGEIER